MCTVSLYLYIGKIHHHHNNNKMRVHNILQMQKEFMSTMARRIDDKEVKPKSRRNKETALDSTNVWY